MEFKHSVPTDLLYQFLDLFVSLFPSINVVYSSCLDTPAFSFVSPPRIIKCYMVTFDKILHPAKKVWPIQRCD